MDEAIRKADVATVISIPLKWNDSMSKSYKLACKLGNLSIIKYFTSGIYDALDALVLACENNYYDVALNLLADCRNQPRMYTQGCIELFCNHMMITCINYDNYQLLDKILEMIQIKDLTFNDIGPQSMETFNVLLKWFPFNTFKWKFTTNLNNISYDVLHYWLERTPENVAYFRDVSSLIPKVAFCTIARKKLDYIVNLNCEVNTNSPLKVNYAIVENNHDYRICINRNIETVYDSYNKRSYKKLVSQHRVARIMKNFGRGFINHYIAWSSAPIAGRRLFTETTKKISEENGWGDQWFREMGSEEFTATRNEFKGTFMNYVRNC